MIFSKLALSALSVSLLSLVTALPYDGDDLYALEARGYDLDEGYGGYSSFARRSAEPEYDDDLDFGLYARDADPYADADADFDAELYLVRREILSAVDSVLARRANPKTIYPASGGKHAGSGSKIPVPHSKSIYPQSGGKHSGGSTLPGMSSVFPPSAHAPEPPAGWRGAREPTKIPGPKGSTRKSAH